ncbi:hypothetical protein C8E03_11759 [Lachnotalea glycerini]|uniref:Uncharacterized protein n=1 Tax=Lachnotalea glycerini TaxID=1763509 RepID=A0A318EIU0_9FIRM|nr:hypothetical protein [Lachnotalea glycerini]OYO59730.1 hypothetical protein CG709_17800 [Lachnotalea glycerini]PXV85423.1 hypothetical protein C8E03_11759 [Lachnotalea glycerini]
MNFKEYFKFESEVIPINLITQLTEKELDDLYSSNDETLQFNVFFILLNEYHYLKKEKAKEELAHVCYLLSYYLFIPLTPPHSEELALAYAEEALNYSENSKYAEWIEEVKRGN